ncbi:MAG: YbaB/EbfC family nucleoid-associated protein [Deltaproteobacteria bacterium]|nr:YbaB/EbfC family nucleoid-associated protein [Deltaproteobacteria bacterium]
MAGFDIQHLMRQARKLEKAMAEAKEKLGELSVEAEAGSGLVKVTMDGRCGVKKLQIDPKVVDPADVAMLEDLVSAAVNAAVEKARTAAEASIQKATGGVQMPGLPY